MAKRILNIGTSTVEADPGYRVGLQDILGVGAYDFVGPYTDDPNPPYDMDHAGVGGESSEDTLARIGGILDTYMPTPNDAGSIVFVYTAGNDYGEGMSNAETTAALDDIVDAIVAHDPTLTIIIGNLKPRWDTAGYEADVPNRMGAIWDWFVAKLATVPKLQLLEMWELVTANSNYKTEWYNVDKIHFNSTGYGKMAEWLAKKINNAAAGIINFTRDNLVSLPSTPVELTEFYTVDDITNVSTSDDVRVNKESNAGQNEYILHQFKHYAGTHKQASVQAEVRAELAPSSSTVYLQVYKVSTSSWETIDYDDTTGSNTDFTLSANLNDLTNYKDEDGIITFRVYQRDTSS
jgi:Lysophospholipase L1 and related esterases